MSPGAGGGVSLRGIAHQYDVEGRALRAVDQVDLDVPSGGFVSLIGPSGCGKTTLLRITAGFLTPSAGTVMIGGVEPNVARDGRRLGWVPQTPSLFPWKTALGNVEMLMPPSPNSHKRAVALLDEVGLSDFGEMYPRHLSVGMQQRVALARALGPEPDLLLLDEPFSALDALLREEMQGLLLDLVTRRSLTALQVTHSITEAVRLSNQIAVLTPGPARVRARISVELEEERRPENESSPKFQEYVLRVRRELAA